jgi:hypothetical protein
MHHASFANMDFQTAYREEPLAFCAGCHAPHAGDSSLGVGCTSCHTDAAEHERGGGRAPVARAGDESCTRCHEFTNPIARTFLQSTVSEHEASDARASSCVDCHMPNGDHRFAVSRDPAFLGRAIALVDVRRTDEGVAVVVAKRGVGHRFPTGDVFRRLAIRAWVEDADGAILGVAERALEREWDAHRAGRREEHDTRLGEVPTELVVPVLGGRASRVRVQVDYQRGAAARAGTLTLFSSLRIADWTRRAPR